MAKVVEFKCKALSSGPSTSHPSKKEKNGQTLSIPNFHYILFSRNHTKWRHTFFINLLINTHATKYRFKCL
jgi:hypothetical protein